MDKFIGKRVDGRYEIHELVGVGGMAYVYRAFDNQTQTWVAIKILKEEFSENSEFLRRFRNESRAIAMLSHPNIVKVLDVSFGDKIQYIVMEYINGITLKDYISKKNVLLWNEAAFFIAQILKALQHAHEKGIIHRDIKPQNIILLQDGTIKVTDFGIARFVQGDTQTMTDKALGSVHYIAPEQARGDFTNDKADIYSVGVMLYEMITGQLPFEAETAVSVAIMQLQEIPVKPREINPDIPIGLEEITMHAMEKKPGMRFLSAREMLADIEYFRRNPSTVFSYARQQNLQETRQMDLYEQIKPVANRSVKSEAYNDNYEYEEELVKSKNHARSSMIITGVISACIVAVLAVGIYLIATMMSQSEEPVEDEILLPNFVGMNYYDEIATDKEYTDNFTFVITETDDDTKEPGVVITQSPDPDIMVKIGRTVDLVVNKGDSDEDNAPVPDVTGKNQNDAYNELTELGFHPVIDSVNDDETPSGYVISTEPTATTIIKKGETVTIFVSKGPSEVQVPVPIVTGLSVSHPTQLLESSGLKVEVQYDDESELAKDSVLSSNPSADTKISEGSIVTLKVSSGKNSVKTVSHDFPLPTHVNADLSIEIYLDGVLVKSATVNPSYTSSYKAEFEGKTGVSNIVIQLEDQDYIYATLDFDTQQVNITSQNPFVWATPTPIPSTPTPTAAPPESNEGPAG